jgi:hypothetical protein
MSYPKNSTSNLHGAYEIVTCSKCIICKVELKGVYYEYDRMCSSCSDIREKWDKVYKQSLFRQCHKCAYGWHTRSLMVAVTCPSCQSKVRNWVECQDEPWDVYFRRMNDPKNKIKMPFVFHKSRI